MFLPLMLLLAGAGCVSNNTTDPSLSGKDAPPRRLCDALKNGQYEVLFKMLPPKTQERATLRTLPLDLNLPPAQYVDRCRLMKLEETARQKGKTVRAKATYVIWLDDGGANRYEMYFKKIGPRWRLLPSWDIR